MSISTPKLALILLLCILAAIVVYLYFSLKVSPTFPNGSVSTTPNTPKPSTAGSQTLGAAIYDGVQNPIQNKIPDSNPVSNPVQGLYKNPFE